MYLDGDSLGRLTEWLLTSPYRREGDHEQIMEFVQRLTDDSWRDRWMRQRDLAPAHGSASHVVHLREGLRLVVVLDLDGEPGIAHVQAILTER